jgi:uncharacterized protein (DUF2147 family)
MKCTALRVLTVMLTVMVSTSTSYSQDKLIEDDLIGEWLLPGSGSVIRAHRCGDRFCGPDVKFKTPRLLDNGSKRSHPAILFPLNLQKRGPAVWLSKLYNLRNGDTYEATIQLIDKKRLRFVRCIIGSVLCETLIFHRMDPPTPSAPQRQERNAISADQFKARTASPKARTAARKPTWADFEAFLKERDINSFQGPTTQERQELFQKFTAWWNER